MSPPPSFSTPLGRLVLGLEVSGVTAPQAAAFAAGDRSVTVWSSPTWFEVLLIPADLAPAWHGGGWRVGGSRGSRRRPVTDAHPKVPVGRWCHLDRWWSRIRPEPRRSDVDGRSDGVTVGLPDYEAATTYRRDGFEVAVGAVPEGQGHFLWRAGPDTPDDISTWFAVDWPTARLVPAEPIY